MISASNSSFIVTGSTEQIIDLLFGPRQHNEHCKGWRWHMYVRDADKRMDAVRAEMRKMLAERRAFEEAILQEAAE